MPSMLANSIVGVQPMTGGTGQIFTMRTNYALEPFRRIECDDPEWVAIVAADHVHRWIEGFSQDQWKLSADSQRHQVTVLITEQLYMMLLLKWS